MADLILEVKVEFPPFLEDGVFEVPVELKETHFHKPDDDSEATRALYKRVRQTRSLHLKTGKDLAIRREDNLLVELCYYGDYPLGYQITKVHVLSDEEENGVPKVDATYYFKRKPLSTDICTL